MIREYPRSSKSYNESQTEGERDGPIRLGTKRKTFSEYVWAVARSTATFASTTSTEGRDLLELFEPREDMVNVGALGDEQRMRPRRTSGERHRLSEPRAPSARSARVSRRLECASRHTITPTSLSVVIPMTRRSQ